MALFVFLIDSFRLNLNVGVKKRNLTKTGTLGSLYIYAVIAAHFTSVETVGSNRFCEPLEKFDVLAGEATN